VPTTTWNRRWSNDLTRFRTRGRTPHYGDRWGDPSVSGLRYFWRKVRWGHRIPGNLAKVRKRYLERYVTPETVALEIGAGGGRWTKYLVRAREVIVVELNDEFFSYLEERFRDAPATLRFYKTGGYEMGAVDDESVDFVFSFGTFVHITPEGIDEYLGEIRRVLRRGGLASIQYADRSKRYFRRRSGYGGFSAMNATKMEALVARRAFEIVEHDRRTLNHSNVVVLRKPPDGPAA
jgi:cyclopropane fatty-acyl-phospholipid synthase-like methyltransferase